MSYDSFIKSLDAKILKEQNRIRTTILDKRNTKFKEDNPKIISIIMKKQDEDIIKQVKKNVKRLDKSKPDKGLDKISK
jgi:hypothetical protein